MYWNDILRKYNLTKKEVAERLGQRRSNICALTAPTHKIKLQSAMNFCRAIGCSVKEVMFGEDYLTFHIFVNNDYYFATSYKDLVELFDYLPITNLTKVHLCYEEKHYYDTKLKILEIAKELDEANKTFDFGILDE